MRIREATFALRVVRRKGGDAALVYRRRLVDSKGERLDRIASISPLAFSAGLPLLRAAVRQVEGPKAKLSYGPWHPFDADWGVRVACYGLASSGIRDAEGLQRAAENLKHADSTEAAWWLGLMTGTRASRATRAFRILVEAVN